MIFRFIIILSIIFQNFSFADSINLSQCNLLKIEKSNCCQKPTICCCKKSVTCKCTIKKPTSSSVQKKEIILSKTTDDDNSEAQQNKIQIVSQKINSVTNFQVNFNLKTYQEYINLPLLA